jgi:molecular chaperone GrpE
MSKTADSDGNEAKEVFETEAEGQPVDPSDIDTEETAESAEADGDESASVDDGEDEIGQTEPIVDEHALQLDALTQQLEKSRSECKEMTARLKSVSAAYKKQQEEIGSAKERIERQASFREARRRGEVLNTLFEPLENLRRSVEAMKRAEVEKMHTDGLDMVIKSFMDGFHQLGLEEIPGKGSKFDPNVHEALMNMPVEDAALHEVVIEVYATGYRIDSLVIKPAQVIVGNYQAPPEEKVSEEDSEGEAAVADGQDDGAGDDA